MSGLLNFKTKFYLVNFVKTCYDWDDDDDVTVTVTNKVFLLLLLFLYKLIKIVIKVAITLTKTGSLPPSLHEKSNYVLKYPPKNILISSIFQSS